MRLTRFSFIPVGSLSCDDGECMESPTTFCVGRNSEPRDLLIFKMCDKHASEFANRLGDLEWEGETKNTLVSTGHPLEVVFKPEDTLLN